MGDLLSFLELGDAEAAVTQAARVVVILLLAWVLQRAATRILGAFRRCLRRGRCADRRRRALGALGASC